VKEGSYFNKGDILLTLDCRVQKADYDKAAAQQTAALSGYKSALRLKSYDAISENEVVKAKADADIANAEVTKLSAILEKCIIKAPYNGAVASIPVHMHESVKPGDPLIKIVSTDHLIVQMEVPSDWLQWVHTNTMFNVHINEINRTIDAKITRINPEIDPVSQSVKIIGEIQPTLEKLLPGMSGQAIFPDNPNNTIKKNGIAKH
jgi:RND family efflux transporter MFP subunit